MPLMRRNFAAALTGYSLSCSSHLCRGAIVVPKMIRNPCIGQKKYYGVRSIMECIDRANALPNHSKILQIILDYKNSLKACPEFANDKPFNINE